MDNVLKYVKLDQEKIDLLYKLKIDDPYRTQGKIPTSGMSESDYPSPDALGVSVFPRAWHHSFPQELKDQFKHIQSNFAIGLLPSISRAWMSIDSDLFLWNFETNRDLAFYDGISNTILAVDVVTPKSGFSLPDMHCILVVVTTCDVVLLAISFRDETGKSFPMNFNDFINSDAYLLGDPIFKVPLEGVIVSHVCCTSNGRIFFGSEDNLYEIEYYGKSWFGGKSCKKVNHSKGLLNYIVPILSIFHSKDEIRQIEVDDSRHLLYLLMNKGAIQIFDLGTDGKSISKFGVLTRDQIEGWALQACSVTSEFFKEIVSIAVIPVTRSYYVNFMAITSRGVRIYFSCLQNEIYPETPGVEYNQDHMRPTAIKMVHVRFPPSDASFSANNLNIYTAYYSKETVLMGAGQNMEISLWALSSSNYPFCSRFIENGAELPVRGNIWKIARGVEQGLCRQQDTFVLPRIELPLVAEQHSVWFEKIFVLTSEGIYTFHHLSPLEIFRQILIKFGTESKHFQALCAMVEPSEICVFALSVVCSDNAIDNSIKDEALRTFFVFGGEPQMQSAELGVHPELRRNNINGAVLDSSSQNLQSPRINGVLHSPRGNISIANFSSLRSPLRTSTPDGPIHAMYTPANNKNVLPFSPMGDHSMNHSIVAGANVVPSSRHDALYIYFSRIINPVWGRRACCIRENSIQTSIKLSEIETVSRFVGLFRKALEDHALISPNMLHYSHFNTAKQMTGDTRDLNLIEQESQSLLKLRSAVIITLETLKLWGILLEHQFSIIISTLPTDLQDSLITWNFEQLIMNRDNISSELITSLIRFYVKDDATTNAISNRLRSSCPTLFTNDDALVVKATENLYRAKNAESVTEKAELITEAVATFQRSIQKLNLVHTCDLLIQILQFKPIVDLALARADKDDTSKLALIAYRKQIGSTDDAINEAVRKRNDAYSCITDTLELLHLVTNSVVQHVSTSTLSSATYLFPSADYVKKLSVAHAKLERDAMITKVFESEDELAHVSIFRWLLSKGMSDFLIESRCRFFEGFLFHEIEEGKGNKYLELLWKYYEKNENYVAAAKILTDMASKVGTKANLSQRITHLSHALMCIQSASETKANLEFKLDIQDKLDVAQIQQKTKALLETSGNQYPDPNKVREAIDALNHQLFGLTDLYDRFGNTFDLPEVKLDVLQSAGHYEQELIESIWKAILNKELVAFVHGSEFENATQSKISTVILKARKHFSASPQFVPIDFILRELLMFSFKSSLLFDWLPALCKAAEIPYSALLNVASYEYRVGDPFWKQNQRAFQFMFDMVVYVCECFKAQFSRISTDERKILRNACLNFIASLQLDSHLGGNAQKINSKKLDLLQSEINAKIC